MPQIKGWKRAAVAMVALGLAGAHVVKPDIALDATTLGLIALSAVALLLPELVRFAPYIKRVRIAGIEIELRDEIRRAFKEFQSAQHDPVDAHISSSADRTSADVLEVAARSPKAALLLLSSLFEREVRDRLRAEGVPSADRPVGLGQLLENGARTGVFPRSFASAARDFIAVRNRIAHGEATDVSDGTVLSVIDLGLSLLPFVSARSNPDGTHDDQETGS